MQPSYNGFSFFYFLFPITILDYHDCIISFSQLSLSQCRRLAFCIFARHFLGTVTRLGDSKVFYS